MLLITWNIVHIFLTSGKIRRTNKTFKLNLAALIYKRSWNFVNVPTVQTVFLLPGKYFYSIFTKTEQCHFFFFLISANRSKMYLLSIFLTSEIEFSLIYWTFAFHLLWIVYFWPLWILLLVNWLLETNIL